MITLYWHGIHLACYFDGEEMTIATPLDGDGEEAHTNLLDVLTAEAKDDLYNAALVAFREEMQ